LSPFMPVSPLLFFLGETGFLNNEDGDRRRWTPSGMFLFGPETGWLARELGLNTGLQLAPYATLLSQGMGGERITPDGGRQLRIPVGQMVSEIQKTAAVAQRQLKSDVKSIEQHNAQIASANGPVLGVLAHFTSQKIKPYRDNWVTWWADDQGYGTETPRVTPKPTVVENVPLAYQPQQRIGQFEWDPQLGYLPRPPRTSCFGIGTLVRTKLGPRPIETLEIGDQVLAQNPENGSLSYQPVLKVFHNPPAALLRITFESESILATGIHRFWKPGHGWVMARELKPGDAIRTCDGLASVKSVETLPPQPVFNLEVAGMPSFFVGRAGALVHDNTLAEPPAHPFDAIATGKNLSAPID
jgi:hypothetical protein